MPKPKKQGRAAVRKSGGGGKRKHGKIKNDGLKKKIKHVDPCIGKELHETIDALAEEIERHDEVKEPEVRKVREKPSKAARQLPSEGNTLALKPGMTAAQVRDKAKKVRKRPLVNIPNQSFEDEEEEEDEEADDAERDGSAGDYSDTANERATEYRKGGYHPVIVGEVYHNRYRVVKKLGWGYFSTVWLVWDYKEEKYQAMKAQKSAKHYTEAAYDEIKLLGEIMAADPDKTRCCARLNDYFEHMGPNGNHVCMVFDVYGEDLLSLIERYEYRGVPLPIVKCISRQILVALEHLHGLDIIHTDLKPENVLLSTPKHAIISLMKRFHPPPLHQRPRLVERDPKTMTKSQLRRYYKKLRTKGKHEGENNENNDADNNSTNHNTDEDSVTESKQEHSQTENGQESETDTEWEIERLHHVVLADFGNSCWTYRQFTDEVQTRQYRCPEVILGEPYSTPIDLWSAACMIFELITGDFLFDPRKGDNYSRDEDHLALMTEMLGELPENMRYGEGKYRSQFYNSRGGLRNIRDLNFWCLEDILYRRYKYTRNKAEEIAEFLLPMLEYDPQKRASATEMLANFEHFFEIKEDDYSPFCFVTSDADREQVEASEYDEEESECSSNTDTHESGQTYSDDDDTDDADVIQYWAEHPILNRKSLKKRGLTVLDIQAVLSGKQLTDETAQEAANEVIRILSEETDDNSDGHHADQVDDGEESGTSEDPSGLASNVSAP